MRGIRKWIRNALRGFTLIELLVVVIIIGILAMIAIPQYAKSVEKSQGGVALATLDNIVKQEEAYYIEHDAYTTDLSDLNIGGNFEWDAENGYAEDSYWRYKVFVPTGNMTYEDAFVVLARRKAGKCRGTCVGRDYCGTVAREDDDELHYSAECQDNPDNTMNDINSTFCSGGWKTCVDAL